MPYSLHNPLALPDFSHDKLYLHKSIHPLEMERNLPKTVCGCPCAEVMQQQQQQQHKTVTQSIFSPYKLHLPVYNCIYQMTPECSAGGTLQRQQLGVKYIFKNQSISPSLPLLITGMALNI